MTANLTILRTHAKTMRHEMTRAEAILWGLLRSTDLKPWHFRRQVTFPPRYIADFASHAAALVVEVDGQSHDFTADDDMRRTDWFAGVGYRMIRFGNSRILNDQDSVWRELCALLPAEGPPPRSRKGASRPPLKGEGQ